MGFFKSTNRLMKQANEIDKTWDPGQQAQDALARMKEANASMAQQTAAANIAATGVEATGTITAVRQGGAMVNFQPMVEVDLTVIREGHPPYPVTVSQVLPQFHLARAQPGLRVHLKVDPDQPTTVWVDWDRPVI